MSKTILGQLSGFTPVIDGMIPEVGAQTALVFGKMWRYCQMSDGVCKAAQERIAHELRMSRATINTHIAKLTKAGYLEDMTPDLAGLPHQYRDTGKANLSISLTATCQNSLQPPVKNFDTKKLPKKESKRNDEDDALAKISRAYSAEIGMITPMIADSMKQWINDGFPMKWVCDAIHEAAIQNKRSWKYCEAIMKRWDSQGNQNDEKKTQQQFRKPVITEPAAFEAIRQFEAMQHGD